MAFTPLPALAQADPPPCVGPVTVTDGDTVEACGIRWRLDGIDAPEIQHARCPAERHKGIKSAARLVDLLAQHGGSIVPTQSRRGRVASGGFGRKLGRLMLGDGTTWAEVAIREGHAVAYHFGREPLPDWCKVEAS